MIVLDYGNHNFVKRDVIDYLKDSIYSKNLAMNDNLSILTLWSIELLVTENSEKDKE